MTSSVAGLTTSIVLPDDDGTPFVVDEELLLELDGGWHV